jgi:hypothetical protein
MRRKRIKHQVDVFCDMFSGWRLINDMETLLELKNGNLEFDFINKSIKLNGENCLKTFHMFFEISDWFERDLLNNNIDKNDLLKASLIVSFLVNVKEGKPRSRSKRIFTIDLKMKSQIFTDEKEYSIEKEDLQEYHNMDNRQFGFN